MHIGEGASKQRGLGKTCSQTNNTWESHSKGPREGGQHRVPSASAATRLQHPCQGQRPGAWGSLSPEAGLFLKKKKMKNVSSKISTLQQQLPSKHLAVKITASTSPQQTSLSKDDAVRNCSLQKVIRAGAQNVEAAEQHTELVVTCSIH